MAVGVLALLCLVDGDSVAAQSQMWFAERPHRTLAISESRFRDGQESSRRLGLLWYGADRVAFGVTAQLSDRYDVAEVEVRRYSELWSPISHYWAASLLQQAHTGVKATGFAATFGVEAYFVDSLISLGFGVGLRALFREGEAKSDVRARAVTGISIAPFLLLGQGKPKGGA